MSELGFRVLWLRAPGSVALLLRILGFRLQHSLDPNTDPLLGFTLGMALR